MLTSDLMKKIQRIEIRTRRMVNDSFAGEYHSIFKGRGMEFDEVRPYQIGDEIRTIDWNVTARFNHPYIKVFEEERELTVMLLVDVSGSREFGSFDKLKKSVIGCTDKQKANVKGLGLRKIGSERELENTPAVRGMIKKVIHLLDIKEN